MQFFNPFSPFFQLVRKVFTLFLLSIVWILCCIPLITAGAVTAALYDTVTKVLRESRGYLFRTFFQSFILNFKQTTIIWGLFLVFAFAMSFNLQIMIYTKENWLKFFILPTIGLCILGSVTMIYYLTLSTKFQNNCIGTLKNAVIMGILHLPVTILIVTATTVYICLAYIWWCFGLIMPAVAALTWSILLERVYDKYVEENDNGKKFR